MLPFGWSCIISCRTLGGEQRLPTTIDKCAGAERRVIIWQKHRDKVEKLWSGSLNDERRCQNPPCVLGESVDPLHRVCTLLSIEKSTQKGNEEKCNYANQKEGGEYASHWKRQIIMTGLKSEIWLERDDTAGALFDSLWVSKQRREQSLNGYEGKCGLSFCLIILPSVSKWNYDSSDDVDSSCQAAHLSHSGPPKYCWIAACDVHRLLLCSYRQIWTPPPLRPRTAALKHCVVDKYGLNQRVAEATHNKERNLDLIISMGVNISEAVVTDVALSECPRVFFVMTISLHTTIQTELITKWYIAKNTSESFRQVSGSTLAPLLWSPLMSDSF